MALFVFQVSIIQIILVFIVVLSCKKKNTVPSIEILSVSKITSQSAVIDIKLNNPSNFTITQKGVLWYTTSGINFIPNPPYNSTSESVNSNQFKSTAINLQPNTTYYFKSVATNASGFIRSQVSEGFRTTSNTINPFDFGYMPPRPWAPTNSIYVAGVSQPWRQTQEPLCRLFL